MVDFLSVCLEAYQTDPYFLRMSATFDRCDWLPDLGGSSVRGTELFRDDVRVFDFADFFLWTVVLTSS